MIKIKKDRCPVCGSKLISYGCFKGCPNDDYIAEKEFIKIPSPSKHLEGQNTRAEALRSRSDHVLRKRIKKIH